MANKTITMTLREGHTCVSIQETFSDTTTWNAIAYQFHKFLAGQGYILDSEDVGAEVDAYCQSVIEDFED
jgi:hypothetical protein